MKKSKLLLVFSCVGLLGVTACDNQAPTSSSSLPPEPPVVKTDTITFSDDKLVTDALIETNSEPKEEVENRKVKNIAVTPEEESFKKENIIDDSHADSGLLVVKNDEGYVGFYSLLHHGWLIKPSFEEGKFSYRVRDLSYIQYVLEIHYRDTYVVLDAFGNILDSGRQFSNDTARYYNDPNGEEYSDHTHFEMADEDQSPLAVRLINDKPVLLLPFMETEEHEEQVEDEYGYPVYEKDEEGNYIYDEDNRRIPVMETVTEYYVTAYFFEYESDGTTTVLMDEYDRGYAHGWPEEIEEEEEEDEEEELKLGDFYINNLEDLSEKGLPGYYLARSGDAKNVYTVYDGTGKVKCSFAVQSSVGAHPLIQEFGIIGEKMVFQAFEQVADDAEEYDVFVRDLNPTVYDRHSGAKYVMESFTYNLLTGERLDFEGGFYFLGQINPIIGAGNGEFLYAVNISKINEDNRTLEAAKTYIVDKNFAAHDDITGFEFYDEDDLEHPFNLLELQDGKFFDKSQRVIYTSKLEPIAHLQGVEGLKYLPEHNVFLAKYNGKWGLIDTNGKVAAEFKYDNIKTESGIAGRFLAYADGELYIVGNGKREVHAGWYNNDEETLTLNVLGNNGLYVMSRTYQTYSQETKTEYEFFDAQSDENGYYQELAEMRPSSTRTVYVDRYDYDEERLIEKSYTIGEVSDEGYIRDDLLGQYTVLFILNGNNEFTIDTVEVLDEYKDPIKDQYGNVIKQEELNSNWVYELTVVAPSNLKLTSYDSGEEVTDAFYAAKDEETAQVISLGENEVLKRESGNTYMSFAPEADGPFIFTANPELALNSAVTERWEEVAKVIRLFARYGETEVNVNRGTMKLAVELEESEENGEEAQEKTYKPEKVNLEDIILHKVYNDKNEAQLKNINSHMAISLDDVTVYRWEELPPAEDADPEAPAQYGWVKYEAKDITLAELGEYKFKLVLNGTEPAEGQQDNSIYFLLEITAKAAPEQQQGGEEQQEEEEEEEWDPTKIFHMITSEDEMFLNQKSRTIYMTKVTNYEPDEEGKQVAVSQDFYFGDNTFDGIEEDEWTEGYLKAGHTYYFTANSSGKTQVNTIEAKESHIHKVSEWLMADIIVPSYSGLESGYKFGICENGKEAIQRDSKLKASENTLTKEEALAFQANLSKDVNRKFGVMASITTTHTVDPEDPYGPGKTSATGSLSILKGLFPEEEIEKYNKQRKKGDPEMVEAEAEAMADLVKAARITAEDFNQFLNGYRNDEEEKYETKWDEVQLRYLYDEDFDYEETQGEGEEAKKVTVHTKSFYSVVAIDNDSNSRLVAIYNQEGVVLYASLEEGRNAQTGLVSKTTVEMNMLYTEQFAQLLLEQYGIN